MLSERNDEKHNALRAKIVAEVPSHLAAENFDSEKEMKVRIG
jgi:hypothetical protein